MIGLLTLASTHNGSAEPLNATQQNYVTTSRLPFDSRGCCLKPLTKTIPCSYRLLTDRILLIKSISDQELWSVFKHTDFNDSCFLRRAFVLAYAKDCECVFRVHPCMSMFACPLYVHAMCGHAVELTLACVYMTVCMCRNHSFDRPPTVTDSPSFFLMGVNICSSKSGKVLMNRPPPRSTIIHAPPSSKQLSSVSALFGVFNVLFYGSPF